METVIPLLTDGMRAEAEKRYGRDILFYLKPSDDACHEARDHYHLKRENAGWTWREPPSVFREAKIWIMRLVLAEPELKEAVLSILADSHWRQITVPQIETTLAVMEEPWVIPTEEELDVLADPIDAMAPNELDNCTCGFSECYYGHDEVPLWKRDYWQPSVNKNGHYGFSATAAAIHFLKSVPVTTRAHMRNLVVNEDRLTVGWPEGHVRGLVPFCTENPSLRIDRRVDLWWCPWLQSQTDRAEWDHCNDGQYHPQWSRRFTTRLTSLTVDNETKTARGVALWMVEASLPQIPDQITLLLDCQGERNRFTASEIFQTVLHRDVAWQTAVQRMFRPSLLSAEDAFYTTNCDFYNYDAFPRLLRELCDGYHAKAGRNKAPLGRIRCSFDPGRPWDDDQIQSMINAHPERDTLEGWKDGFMDEPDLEFEIYPPYPDIKWMIGSLCAHVESDISL